MMRYVCVFLVVVAVFNSPIQFTYAGTPIVCTDPGNDSLFFDSCDIVTFDWDRQCFELSRERAMDLYAHLAGLRHEFILSDDRGSIYGGEWVSIASSVALPGPVIEFPGLGDALQPPLYRIQLCYPAGAFSQNQGDDPRYSERLREGLARAGALGYLDLHQRPDPIQVSSHGWYGPKDGLRMFIRLFPETLRWGQTARFHIHLIGADAWDPATHVVEICVDGELKQEGTWQCSTRRVFPLQRNHWRDIYVVKTDPWKPQEDGNQSSSFVIPAFARAVVQIRKVLDASTNLYSDSLAMVISPAIDVQILPSLADPENVFAAFMHALKAGRWDLALSLCTQKVRIQARAYDSAQAFFEDRIPLELFLGSPGPRSVGKSSIGDREVQYHYELRYPDPELGYPLHWPLSVDRFDNQWWIQIPDKPFSIWLKHARLKSRFINDENPPDIDRLGRGLEFRLESLDETYYIGNPMNFRLRLLNTSTKILGYPRSPWMVNDPIEVKDPHGRVLPYREGMYQVGVSTEFIDPGAQVVLVDSYDLRSQYHLIESGSYTLQFRNSLPMATSKHIEVEIKPGTPAPLESVTARLLDILPEGWWLTRRFMPRIHCQPWPRDRVLHVSLISRPGGKASRGLPPVGIFLQIYLDTDTFAPDLTMDPGDVRCKSPWGPVQISFQNVEEMWPDGRAAVIRALNLECPMEVIP